MPMILPSSRGALSNPLRMPLLVVPLEGGLKFRKYVYSTGELMLISKLTSVSWLFDLEPCVFQTHAVPFSLLPATSDARVANAYFYNLLLCVLTV